MAKIFQIAGDIRNNMFIEKMDKFARRAGKLGIEFGYKLESVTKESYDYRDPFGEMITVFYDMYHYSVCGESPTINGYSFLAKIEPMEDGINLVHSHNSDYDFSSYRNAKLICEHCHTNRQRNFYFLIQNDNDKTVKMVGGNCLANYINLPNAEDIAEFYNGLLSAELELQNNHDSYSDSFNNGNSSILVSSFVNIALYSVKTRGYVKTQDNNLSTKEHSLMLYFRQGMNKKERESLNDFLAQNKNESDNIILAVKNYLSGKNTLTEYENNILTLINGEYMKVSHAGYIASIIPLYNKITEYQAKNQDKKDSEWLGNEDEKLENIKAIVSYQNQLANDYGVTYVYKFMSGDNIITYFASNDFYLTNGEEVTIVKCTVKKHDTYNGQKQTVITRAKIQSAHAKQMEQEHIKAIFDNNGIDIKENKSLIA